MSLFLQTQFVTLFPLPPKMVLLRHLFLNGISKGPYLGSVTGNSTHNTNKPQAEAAPNYPPPPPPTLPISAPFCGCFKLLQTYTERKEVEAGIEFETCRAKSNEPDDCAGPPSW